jgi:hypothetical protein
LRGVPSPARPGQQVACHDFGNAGERFVATVFSEIMKAIVAPDRSSQTNSVSGGMSHMLTNYFFFEHIRCTDVQHCVFQTLGQSFGVAITIPLGN